MRNEAGTQIGSNDTATFEAEVRSAVEQGNDVQEMVRQLTLGKISQQPIDLNALRQIIHAVLRSARASVGADLHQTAAQIGIARDRLKVVVAGLDAALAQFAEAAKLALEEAASRAQTFSAEDLARAHADLKSLEAMFIETLKTSVADGKDVAGEILYDLAAHAHIHGSAVRAQLKETLAVVTHQLGAAGRTQVGTGRHLAQATADLLRQAAAGVLTGLADRVKPANRQDKAH